MDIYQNLISRDKPPMGAAVNSCGWLDEIIAYYIECISSQYGKNSPTAKKIVSVLISNSFTPS